MITYIAYAVLGCIMILLIKHKRDISAREKSCAQKSERIVSCDFSKQNEALAVTREINKNLRMAQQRQAR